MTLLYKQKGGVPWPLSKVEDEPGKSKLRIFKAKIDVNLVRDVFTSPDNLASEVVADEGRYITHSKTGRKNKLEDMIVNLAVETFDMSIVTQFLSKIARISSYDS